MLPIFQNIQFHILFSFSTSKNSQLFSPFVKCLPSFLFPCIHSHLPPIHLYKNKQSLLIHLNLPLSSNLHQGLADRNQLLLLISHKLHVSHGSILSHPDHYMKSLSSPPPPTLRIQLRSHHNPLHLVHILKASLHSHRPNHAILHFHFHPRETLRFETPSIPFIMIHPPARLSALIAHHKVRKRVESHRICAPTHSHLPRDYASRPLQHHDVFQRRLDPLPRYITPPPRGIPPPRIREPSNTLSQSPCGTYTLP